MDLQVIKTFLGERLSTKGAVEEAAAAVGVSAATMYRYKSNPETMGLGTLVLLKDRLGLPLQSGAAWAKADVITAERRRLALERDISNGGGKRLTTVSPYTANLELPEMTRLMIQEDYGTKAPQLEKEILSARIARAKLYESGAYESWEIWHGFGYLDFFHGRGRFSNVPSHLRQAQIEKFISSARNPKHHRFFYMRHCPELPMFGVYSPPGVALVRVDDIHLEYQAAELIKGFEETFDEILTRCATKTVDQFIDFASDPGK